MDGCGVQLLKNLVGGGAGGGGSSCALRRVCVLSVRNGERRTLVCVGNVGQISIMLIIQCEPLTPPSPPPPFRGYVTAAAVFGSAYLQLSSSKAPSAPKWTSPKARPIAFRFAPSRCHRAGAGVGESSLSAWTSSKFSSQHFK